MDLEDFLNWRAGCKKMLDEYGISPDGIRSKGSIKKQAVLLGENFTCDGHFDRPVRIVTHAHYDHLNGLKTSLKECEEVIMTPTTKKMLTSLYGDKFGRLGDANTLEVGESKKFDGEKLTFHKASHIPGSVQVLVETGEDDRALYTGDFKLSGTPVINTDLLIIEATYGRPSQIRVFQNRIEQIFKNFVEKKLKEGPVNILGYHGKLQEALQILRKEGVENPAIMPEEIYGATKACEIKDSIMGEFYSEREIDEENLSRNHIGLYHMNQDREFRDGGTNIRLSGWIFDSPIKRRKDGYTIGLSDHCDFSRLLEYVRESNPRYVITDGTNNANGESLAREIRKKLGKPAVSMPQ